MTINKLFVFKDNSFTFVKPHPQVKNNWILFRDVQDNFEDFENFSQILRLIILLFFFFSFFKVWCIQEKRKERWGGGAPWNVVVYNRQFQWTFLIEGQEKCKVGSFVLCPVPIIWQGYALLYWSGVVWRL